MKRQLYLHIGAQRTATTTLQRTFHRNAAALARQGMLYPYDVPRHHVLMRDLFSTRRSAAGIAAELMALADAEPQQIRAILLSDEAICRQADPSRLAALGKYFDVRVVFCLRRQDLWLESWYLQNIKWQWDPALSHLTFKEFLARRQEFPWIHYDAYIRRLEKVFGDGSLRLFLYENARMPDGPVAAFCDLVGLTGWDGFDPIARANSSFAPMLSEFMRCLPLGEAPEGYRATLERACLGIGSDRDDAAAGAPLLLEPAERREILAEYDSGNRAVAQRLFGREALFSDPLPAVDAPIARLQLPDDGYGVMEELVVPFVRQLIALHRERVDKSGKT